MGSADFKVLGGRSTAKQTKARLRRREKRKSDLREFLLQACCAAGLLVSLPWAISYRAGPVNCPAEAGICFETINSTLVPILMRSGVGLVAGLLIGVFLCRTVPGLRRREL